MKKITAVLAALASLLIMMVSAPAQAVGETSVEERCYNFSNSIGTASTNVCFKVWATNTSGAGIRVDRIRVYAANPAGLQANNSIHFDTLQIRNSSALTVWRRDNTNINKVVGEVDKDWYPDQQTTNPSRLFADYKVNWSDGSSDSATAFFEFDVAVY